MEKLQFKTTINAPREKVWNSLWDDANYREWTSVFGEGSHVKTDNWQKGSKVLFFGNENSGMVARIADNIPNEYMDFEHLGEIKDGVEDTISDKVKAWAGAHETYRLKQDGNNTELIAEMDLNADFKDFFTSTFPKALEKVKQIAERN